MFCKKCGNELEGNEKFCPSCGEPVIKEPKKKPKKKEKHWKILILAAGLLASGIGTFVFLMNYYSSEDNIVMYENGDMVYYPQEEDIVWNKEECVLYYDNLLTVYLNEELSEKQEKTLARKIHGKVVTRINGAVNVIQVKVKSTDFSKLNIYAEKLKESEEVFDALYDVPYFISENADDKNPWSDSKEVISDKNSENPGGNDWWAEAIEAYDAWKYVDVHKDKLSDVTVGILDSGFDTGHEDLRNENDSNKISALDGYANNTAGDHGTHVMGIIGANNNEVGIRGIADLAKIKYVDWTPNTNNKKDSDNYTSLLASGEYIRISSNMIEQGSIINNSWGSSCDFKTEKEYKHSNLMKFFKGEQRETASYEEYCKTFKNDCKQDAKNCINMMTKSMEKGYRKFLIIQSAGNGNSANTGVETTLNGHYSTVTEDVFNEWKNGLNDTEKKSMEKYSYENIKEHILIVGAVENEEENGQYKMTTFSNYGENVDICAPGKDVYSTVTTEDDSLENNSAEDGKIYSEMSGTSMSAPMVSASAALLWSINPDLSAGEVKNILIETAETAKKCQKDDTRETYPMLNIGEAVKETVMNIRNREYKKIIEQREQEFGIYTLHDMGIKYATGLCYLELRDVDDDGVEELFLVYNKSEDDTDNDRYQSELWTCENGKAVQLESDVVSYSNGGFPSVCWSEVDGKTYFIINSLSEFRSYGIDSSGKFTIIDNEEMPYLDSKTCLVNGKEVSLEEWQERYQTYINNMTAVQLYYQGEDEVYSQVQQVKDAVSEE